MKSVLKANQRGHFDHGWLDTSHSFSFGDYYNPERMGYGTLRVINDDKIKPDVGFPTYPHRDMEIITYVLEGELAHKDSMGNGSIIKAGQVQYMSAGKGVTHSEYNNSKEKPVHLFQIWILPDKKGYEPRYDQRDFPLTAGEFVKIASSDGSANSIAIRQNVNLYALKLLTNQKVSLRPKLNSKTWVQILKGKVKLNDLELEAGDGCAVEKEEQLEFLGMNEQSQLLVFEMA